MLLYIIDGFNLLHKIRSLKNSASPHQDLINHIRRNRLTGSRNNKVIIVFDGKINHEIHERDYEVVFSQQISADEVIKKRTAAIKNKRQVVVITDDRQIRDDIKRQGASCRHIADFIKVKRKNIEVQKKISYSLQREITEELRKIWLKDE